MAEKYQALRPVLGRLIQKPPSSGVPRLKKALAEQEGMVVNAKLLRKLLRVWGLTWQRTAGAGQRKKTWVQRVIDSLGSRAHLVGHLQITACFQVLVTEMTRLAFAGGIAYLSVHLDWYGKLVLGWELWLHPDPPLALASLQMALAAIIEWKAGTLEGLIVHQDQASPYPSGDSVTAVLEGQAFLSSSRPATPGDHPVNESFFSRGRRPMG